MNNPLIYEINTRVFLRRFDSRGQRATFSSVPDTYWERLAKWGCKYVWLMGVWPSAPSTIEAYCMEEGLVGEYRRALPDFRQEDVVGSPYAIDTYEVAEDLGGAEELAALRRRLNAKGMGLILDFVPNHFSAHSVLTRTRPDLFVRVPLEEAQRDPDTYYVPPGVSEFALAHGKDPYFAAWKDTVQVNYFSKSAREYMEEVIAGLAQICDGIRCDMAMLVLNEIFEKTWGHVVRRGEMDYPDQDFWAPAVTRAKSVNPEFLFLAEVYWNLEWRLQQLGFDFVYDKRLYDRLVEGNSVGVHQHLQAEYDYQRKLVRFIENHDEPRAAAALGEQRGKAAGVIIATVPGMRLIHDGQCEGKQVRLPVQLGREPEEQSRQEIAAFYEQLGRTISSPLFAQGAWQLLDVNEIDVYEADQRQLLAWEWRLNQEHALVVVNYGASRRAGHIRSVFSNESDEVCFKDLFTKQQFVHASANLAAYGLYVALDPYQFHLLNVGLAPK